MLVVPERSVVTLRFEPTWVEWTGSMLTIAGFVVLILAVASRLRRRSPAVAP
jgi:hypothetical protein